MSLPEFSRMGNLVNGDIPTLEVLAKRQLERFRDAPTITKRRRVSAIREFPLGCGRSFMHINDKPSNDSIVVGPADNSELKMSAFVDAVYVKPQRVSVDADKASVIQSAQLPAASLSDTKKQLESLAKVEALEQIKTVGSPKFLDQIEVINPSEILEPKLAGLSKTESINFQKNLDDPLTTGLIVNVSDTEEKRFSSANSSITVLSPDLPEQLNISNQSQVLPVAETVKGCLHKKFPRRRISACRDFPRGCGKNTPGSMTEYSQKYVCSYGENSSVSKKKQIVPRDAKELREKVWDGKAQMNNDFKKVSFTNNHERVTSKCYLERRDKKGDNNRPPLASSMPQSNFKPSSSSKKLDRELACPGGNVRQENVKLKKDTSLKVKSSEKFIENFHTIGRSQEKEYVHRESFNDRVVVQSLFAAPNCPWRQGTQGLGPPLTLETAKLKEKKQEIVVHDNSKLIFREKKNKAKTSAGKSKKKKMSPATMVVQGGSSQRFLKNFDDFPGDEGEDQNSVLIEKSQGSVLSFISHGLHDNDKEGEVTRKKVKETLRLFQAIFRKLMQEAEAKVMGGHVFSSRRFDLMSGKILKAKHRWVNTGTPFVGPVPGVEVGDEFHYRVELAIIGMHHPFQSGIDYINGANLATSIVASGGYDDDLGSSDILKYSGQGGNPDKGKKAEDQKLVRGNLALKNSMDQRSPVRVIHGFKEGKGSDKVSMRYTYDGLYMVERYWVEKGRYGTNVFMFELRRIPGQPELALKELIKSKKAKVREGLCALDISQGKEKMPICAINTLDDEKPPPFTYITKMIYPSWYKRTSPRGCDCTHGCTNSEKCFCALKNGGEIPFNYDGAIVEVKHLVHECGPSCKCPPSCPNRVSQLGIRCQLEIFKTKSRGWGVRSLTSILSGSFICEYTGELLQDKEAEERTGSDEYLFDIGNSYNDPFLEGLSTVMPSEVKSSSSCESEEDVGFTIDAAKYGSIGRFVNHSCSPNLYAQNVLYDHDDKKMPHIMLFAAENIPPLQELTYHYNYQLDQVYDSDGNIKKKDCYCGSVECTGRMY